MTWLDRPSTQSELAVSITVTQPMQRFNFWLFKQQHEKLFQSDDPTQRPIVALATPKYSPAVKALSELGDLLEGLPYEVLSLLDGAELSTSCT